MINSKQFKKLITYNIDEFTNLIPNIGCILGLDLGDKRIGVAISDRNRSFATSLNNIERNKLIDDISIIKTIISENDISAIIVGRPVNLNGKPGKKAQSIRRLAEEINKALQLPLLFWDERFSSQAVENCALDGTSIDIDSGTLDSANFKQSGTSSYALDACEHEPDFYKLIGFKIMLCKADPYNENGVAPDFSVCNATLIESSTGAEIVIQPGVETNLLAGAGNLIIPVGDYPYAALIASNHIYIKHSESFSRGGSAYTMAGYGTSASGYSTGTS